MTCRPKRRTSSQCWQGNCSSFTPVQSDRIIGTIGLLDDSGRGVLKKFFVARPHRGASGPAWPLFNALIEEARSRGLTDIVLDTPAIAKRSHVFYARAGFEPITVDDLPLGYDYPDRSSLLLQLDLSRQKTAA